MSMRHKQTQLSETLMKHKPNLEDIRSLDEAHEREEAAIGPAVNGNTAQVHKVKFLRHVLQPLHLVFNLHLTLIGGEQRGQLTWQEHTFTINLHAITYPTPKSISK